MQDSNKVVKASPGVVVKLSSSASLRIASIPAASAPSTVDSASAISTYARASNKKTVSAFTISDTAQNIFTNLDALQTLAAAGKIASISFSNGTPKWTVAASKFKSDKDILAKLMSAVETVTFAKSLSAYRVTPGSSGGVTIAGGSGVEPTSLALTTAKFLQFSDTKVIASSGNANVDAILNIGTKYWWQGGSAAVISGNNITTGLNSLDSASSKHTLNYSFMGVTKPTLVTGTNAVGYAPMTEPEKTAVRAALDYLSTLINVTFTDVSNTATTADISFGQNTQASSAGYANYPNGNGANPTSYLFLAKNQATNPQGSSSNGFNLGTYGWETIIHEIGHTLGLKHPGNYNAGGGGTVGPYLPSATDNRRYSSMSYNDPVASKSVTASGSQTSNRYSYGYSTEAVNPSTYGLFDIAALQFLYGANTNSTASTITATNNYTDFQTVWAPNGVQVDASATTTSDVFDLRAGSFSSIAIKSKTVQTANIQAQLQQSGLNSANAAAAATSIMKTIVPNATSINPIYDGLNNLALSYGSKYSEVIGGSANDSFYASNYAATIDGGSGTNQVWLPGSASDWTLTGLSQATSKSNSNVALTLRNIQAIGYYNATTTSITHSAVA
ncbi:hypothetical protein Pas1_03065 [Polynucleobacter paneuropaeus]|uniref:Peptidase metallopeptidase domain-containing protein n=1 Tax=Polynucleobacter paneuropaeus TaxID=2527775 RepID=A0A2Z4JRH0_9BURK|nr:hypothetical protein Pas1_03065 [Polynucleobacter paneuropaeus]